MDPISLFGLGLSVAALSLSLLAFVDGRKKDKRDLFLEMHRLLISPEMQRARRTIFEQSEAGWQTPSSDDKDAASQALAYFDLLGLYIYRGHISKDETLEVWGPTIARTVEAAAPFIEMRRRRQAYLWANLSRLAGDASAVAKASGATVS